MYTVFDDIEQTFVRRVRRFDMPRQLAPVEIAIRYPQHIESFASASTHAADVGASVNGHTAATPPSVAMAN
jgi:hypothetical protein